MSKLKTETHYHKRLLVVGRVVKDKRRGLYVNTNL
jgi:hypothetical protein